MENQFAHAELLVLSGFYLVQILTLSYFLSAKWCGHRLELLNSFPQKSYPNLYVVSESEERRRIQLRRYLDWVVLCAGFIGLLIVWYFQPTQEVLVRAMLGYSLVQILPSVLSSWWCKANGKLMSFKSPSAIRQVSLSARKMSDFVPFYKIGLAAALFLAMVVISLIAAFMEGLGDDAINAVYFLLLGSATGGYLWWRVNNLLYGKKTDHFISPQDRHRLLSIRVKQLVMIMSYYSLFSICMLGIGILQMSLVYLFAFTSVVLQVTMFLSLPAKVDIDREVYR